MTWKDTLRKAPFDTGRVKREAQRYFEEDRKRRLKEFPKLLEEILDKQLEDKIKDNPNADEIKIKVGRISDLGMHLDNLIVDHNIKPSQLEQIMEDEYNVDSVRINTDRTEITFKGIGSVVYGQEMIR